MTFYANLKAEICDLKILREQNGGLNRMVSMEIENVGKLIHVIRGQRVMLDMDLAALYGVTTGNLNKAVSRNSERFPVDFMIELARDEYQILRFQFGSLRWGAHSKYPPRAFTQEGVAMLSSVLRSSRAIEVNVAIMRAFVTLRNTLTLGTGLPERMEQAEQALKALDLEQGEHAAQINELFAKFQKKH